MLQRKGYLIAAILIIIALLAILIFNDCTFTSTNVGNKTYTQMSNTEKASWMLSLYNSQYADYMTKVGYSRTDDKSDWVKTREANLTEAEKDVLREKKKTLQALYPLIAVFAEQSQFGGTPSRETEEKILELLNRL